MSAFQFHKLPPPPPRPSSGSNAMGLTGFILSLVGLVTCGCFSPLGLIFSAFGMRREPRGFAIAGLAISGLGLLCLAILIAYGFTEFRTLIPTLSDGYDFAKEIETYKQSHNGAAPMSWSELPNMPPGGPLDHWGHPYRYTLDASRVLLISDGPDGVQGTPDDIHMFIGDHGSVRAYVGRPPSFMR